MEKKYNPQEVEEKIYQLWEKKGYFTPKIEPKKKPFIIIMPPPNANAPLHVGHALFITIEDIMIRYHRMCGEATLWLPGADHAGILTQVTFERKLVEEGKTKYDLGRKKFFSEIMKFTLANKKTMERQVKALGASCDWTRNSFTLDPKFDKSIYTVFKKLYNEGLIYRDKKMINWCPRCETALSDLEVEHKETKSKLWYIKYKLKTQNSKLKTDYITVATTRPETMLGDTAVAIHPEDKRYSNLVGQKAILPLMNREIPIIADQAVDPEFGTGAVKITPAHDPDDFEISQRQKLKTIQVIGFDNKMTKEAGKYAGLNIREARKKVLVDLKKLGLLKKEKGYTHSVGHCERCKNTIEPLISMQWFIKIKPLARPAIKVVKDKKIKIIPSRFGKIYFNWLENIKDWCISRQLWWGHQLPVWYCLSCSRLSENEVEKLLDEKGLVLPVFKREIYSKLDPIIRIDEPKKCPKCGNTNLIRDSDTLDTWFSSGQWPFNTLGWPKKTGDFQYFYPTSVMETGYEILFFWVARMIMLGLYATGKIPFKTVYLHGMVRDVFGKKMSKSRPETCIDPMATIKKYGADALRMALVMGNAPGTDSSLAENKIRGMRNFANKIWNASRFVLSHEAKLKTQNSPKDKPLGQAPLKTTAKNLKLEDKKMIKAVNKLVIDVTKHLDNFRFDLAAEELYHFFWHEFCDKYIESTKPRLKRLQAPSPKPQAPADKQADAEVALATLLTVLETSLRLLHPFMPFVTEEIYQRLSHKGESIMIASWPKLE